MDTNTIPPTAHIAALPADLQEDADAIVAKLVSGTPVPPHIRERIRRRGEAMREEYRRRNGVTNIAAELIRESREEE